VEDIQGDLRFVASWPDLRHRISPGPSKRPDLAIDDGERPGGHIEWFCSRGAISFTKAERCRPMVLRFRPPHLIRTDAGLADARRLFQSQHPSQKTSPFPQASLRRAGRWSQRLAGPGKDITAKDFRT
jgi:hypothetical protein